MIAYFRCHFQTDIAGGYNVPELRHPYPRLGPGKRTPLLDNIRSAISGRTGGSMAVLTDCFSIWLIAPTVGTSANVRSPKRGETRWVMDLLMRYMRIRTFALKMLPVGIEPDTLNSAAQTVTQLTKCTSGKTTPPFLQTQNGTTAQDVIRENDRPQFYGLKTKRRPARQIRGK